MHENMLPFQSSEHLGRRRDNKAIAESEGSVICFYSSDPQASKCDAHRHCSMPCSARSLTSTIVASFQRWGRREQD